MSSREARDDPPGGARHDDLRAVDFTTVAIDGDAPRYDAVGTGEVDDDRLGRRVECTVEA